MGDGAKLIAYGTIRLTRRNDSGRFSQLFIAVGKLCEKYSPERGVAEKPAPFPTQGLPNTLLTIVGSRIASAGILNSTCKSTGLWS